MIKIRKVWKSRELYSNFLIKIHNLRSSSAREMVMAWSHRDETERSEPMNSSVLGEAKSRALIPSML